MIKSVDLLPTAAYGPLVAAAVGIYVDHVFNVRTS